MRCLKAHEVTFDITFELFGRFSVVYGDTSTLISSAYVLSPHDTDIPVLSFLNSFVAVSFSPHDSVSIIGAVPMPQISHKLSSLSSECVHDAILKPTFLLESIDLFNTSLASV